MSAIGDFASAGMQLGSMGGGGAGGGGETGGMSAADGTGGYTFDINAPTGSTWNYNPPNPLDDGQDILAV